MGLDARKHVHCCLLTTKAQTRLRIHAVWSAPLLCTYWNEKTGFLALRPKSTWSTNAALALIIISYFILGSVYGGGGRDYRNFWLDIFCQWHYPAHPFFDFFYPMKCCPGFFIFIFFSKHPQPPHKIQMAAPYMVIWQTLSTLFSDRRKQEGQDDP